MKVVRDRPEAKWLPSRHHFALARLIGYVMLRTGRPSAPEVDHIVLTIDRDQSAVENHAASAWYLASVTCFIAATLPLPLLLGLTLAVPLALIAIQLALYSFGLLSRSRTAVSVAFVVAGLLPALYFATRPEWIRFVSWFFIAAIVANGVAAFMMWLLRDRVRELERRCVA